MTEKTEINTITLDLDTYDEMNHMCEKYGQLTTTLKLICNLLKSNTYVSSFDANVLDTIDDEVISHELISIVRFRHPDAYKVLLHDVKETEGEE